jgi:hypothetical protein
MFTDEQARAAVNLAQRYRAWMDAERELHAMPYDLRRKHVGKYTYLYEINDRSGNGKSLGAMDEQAETRLNAYSQAKAAAKKRRDGARPGVEESARLCRALRLPMLSSLAGEILREADKRRLLGDVVLVVGTNAMPAYAMAAAGFINEAPDETEDFDLAWAAEEPQENKKTVWDMLKAVDSTFTVNTERMFQARNAKAYEVELLIAPSREKALASIDMPRPIPLPEQEWLLLGRRVDEIVVCRNGAPARIVAPDPRWFALHKLWMAQKPERNPLKKPKDAKQGKALLDVVAAHMPQYDLGTGFAAELPSELVPHYEQWLEGRKDEVQGSW